MLTNDTLERRHIMEWELLKTLRSYRRRILTRTGYRKLERATPSADTVKQRTDTSLVEDGLRTIMIRNDLDVHFDGGLDEQSFDQSVALLKELCATLESVVNTSLFTEAFNQSESNYPNLYNLLRALESLDFKFVMISGKGRKLFLTANLESTRRKVDAFNSFLDRLTQPDLCNLQVPEPEKSDNEDRGGFGSQLHETVRLLQILFGWFKRLAYCKDSHNILLRLPEWDTTTFLERKQPYVDLYLSTPCCKPSQWQETRFRSLIDKNEDWQAADKLCDDIEDSYQRPERLDLGVSDDEILVYYGNTEPLKTSTQSLKSLRHLLETNPLDPLQSPFQEMEKKAIAASLVLGLTLTSGTDYMINFWDAKSIFVLVGPDNKCISGGPYALCIPPTDKRTHPPQLVKSQNNQEAGTEDKFALLTTLLLEIECGRPLDYLRIGKDSQAGPYVTTLDDYIHEQWTKDLTRHCFFRALKTCLDFRQKCLSMITTGYTGGEIEAARIIANRIIQDLHTKVQVKTEHFQYTRTTDSLEIEASYGIFMDSDPERLGFANSVAATRPLTALEISRVDSELPIRPSKVRFADDSPMSHTGISEEYRLVHSPIGADCFQLFGDEDAEDISKEFDPLRKSAKDWIKNFKELRKRKIGTQAKERIKVAILDTGIDMHHPDFRGEIREHECFVHGSTIQDTCGHGTHIAGIIRDLTINVDLYIIKVVESRESQDRSGIIEGLRQAQKWEVNMISLSLGYRRHDNPDLVQKEIENCLNANIMVFASASNDAGNQPRTYPGDYDRVFCIHSATGGGNKSRFNPSPEPPESRKDNFSFVGDYIRSSWPCEKENWNEKRGEKYLSGTSIATPVAVSVAAFMQAYVAKHLREHKFNIEPGQPEGMRKILSMMSHKRDDYDWISPQWYFQRYTDEQVKANLKSKLRAWRP